MHTTFFGVSNNGSEHDQDLYSGLTLESRSVEDRWHNLVRYGITRKREQGRQYAYEGTPVFFPGSDGYPGYTEYFGNVVTIRGANGYTATGQADFFGGNSNSVSNRDELYFQSDYAFSRRFTGLVGFRYENERGSFVDTDYGEDEISKRTNYEYTLQFQGDVKKSLSFTLPAERSRRTICTALRERRGLGWRMCRCALTTAGSAARSCERARRPGCRSQRWHWSSQAFTRNCWVLAILPTSHTTR